MTVSELNGVRVRSRAGKSGPAPERQIQPQPSREEQAAADRRRLEMYQRQMQGRERLRQQLEDELRAHAVKGTPLTPGQLERLTSRLVHRPKAKGSRLNEESTHSKASPGAATAPSSSPAIRHLLTDADRFLKRCSAAIGALVRACEGGLAEGGQMMEHQRLLHRDSLGSLDGRRLVARGEALLKSPLDSAKARAGLERRCRQLKETTALLRRLLTSLEACPAGWPELSEGIDAAMRDDCGVYVNRTVLSAHDAEYRGFSRGSADGEDDHRRLLGGLRQRVLSRALSSALSNDETEGSADDAGAAKSYERSLDEEGVAFTDTVIDKLRARLAMISVENGRNPEFSIEDEAAPHSDKASGIASPSRALPIPVTANGGSADVSYEDVVDYGDFDKPRTPLRQEPSEIAVEDGMVTEIDDSEPPVMPTSMSGTAQRSEVSPVVEIADVPPPQNSPDLVDSEEASQSSQAGAMSIKERLRARLSRRE